MPESEPRQKTWHALKAAGDLSYLFNCSREDLQWARKRFVAAYTLIYETGQDEHLLGAAEAKRVLARIKAGPPREQLAPLTPSGQPESSGGGIPRDEVRAALDRIVKSSAAAHGLAVQETPSSDGLRMAEPTSPTRSGRMVPETLDGQTEWYECSSS